MIRKTALKILGKCEFCGSEKYVGEGTPFHGNYCADCIRMNIEYDKNILKSMNEPIRIKEFTSEQLQNLEIEKDKAMKALMSFGYKK